VKTGKTLSGLFWNGAESFFLQLIQLGVSMVLARMLTAVDFGLIALMSVFITVADTIAQGGFRATIIMRPNLKDIDYSTAFIYNLAVAVLLYLGLFFSAPLIASFYKEPKLIKLVRVLSLVNIIHAGYFVQDALLQKQMQFKILAKRNITASFISGLVSITLAYLGFGVWSLVALTISRALVINVYLWLTRVWKISLKFSFDSFKKNFSFGSRMMLTNITGALFNNLNNLLIGKYYSKADLGYYYQALKLKNVPINSASGIITKTASPLIAKYQDDFEELHRTYFHIMRIMAVTIVPLVVLLFVLGQDLIVLLFSSRWLDSVPIFRIIIIGGIFLPFIIINGLSPAVMGDSKFYFRYDSLLKVLLLLVTLVALRFGLYVFIASQTVFSALQMVLNSLVARKYYKVGLRAQLKVYLPYFIYSSVAGFISYLLIWFSGLVPILQITLGSLLFMVVFAVEIYLLERKTFDDLMRLIRLQLGKLHPKGAA
jgi:O-antigen/teichoic acid export membrane protein